MRTDEAIRRMCEATGGGTVTVSVAMGKTRSYLSALLSRGTTPKADTLAQIAQACGYELVLRGRGEELTIDPE